MEVTPRPYGQVGQEATSTPSPTVKQTALIIIHKTPTVYVHQKSLLPCKNFIFLGFSFCLNSLNHKKKDFLSFIHLPYDLKSLRKRVDRLRLLWTRMGPDRKMRSLLYQSTWKCTHDVISSMLEDLASSWLFPLLQNETFDLKNKANAIYQGPQRPIFRHAPSQKIALAK